MQRRSELLPIMDPRFNLREVCKQLTLLEDHLNQPRKRCPDCIRKHFLTIEALLEEAVSLVVGYPKMQMGGEEVLLSSVAQVCTEVVRREAQEWLNGTAEEDIAGHLRHLRKVLTPSCFDLRSMKASSARVASRYVLPHVCGR